MVFLGVLETRYALLCCIGGTEPAWSLATSVWAMFANLLRFIKAWAPKGPILAQVSASSACENMPGSWQKSAAQQVSLRTRLSVLLNGSQVRGGPVPQVLARPLEVLEDRGQQAVRVHA